MRIEWATVCLGAEVDPDGFPVLRGLFIDITWVDRLREPLPLLVALIVVESYANFNLEPGGVTRYPIRWAVRGPDGRLLSAAEDTFAIYIRPDEFPEGWDGRTMVTLPIVFTPTTEGSHDIQIIIGDEPAYPLVHVVRLQSAAGD